MLDQATVVLIFLVALIALDHRAVESPAFLGDGLAIACTPFASLETCTILGRDIFLVVHCIVP